MARFDTSGLDELINEMERLGQNEGPVAEEMCMAAVEEIKKAWKESAEEHGHRDTGAMIGSIGFASQTPMRAGSVIYNDVYPQGVDAHGVRNAEKAFILNYGTSKIPGSHWVEDADEKAAGPVQAVCEAIWDRFLQSGGG